MQKGLVPFWLVIFLVVSAVAANGILYAVKTYPYPLPPLVISHSSLPSTTTEPTFSPPPTTIATQTPDPSPVSTIIPGVGPNGWNTYQNYIYHYQISYPPNFYSTEIKDSNGTYWATFTSYDPNDPERDKGPGLRGARSTEIAIRIIPYPGKGGSLTSWSHEIEYVKSATTIVAGEIAIRGQTESLGFHQGLITVMKGEDGYHIAYTPFNSQYSETFEQMLKTFRFTK